MAPDTWTTIKNCKRKTTSELKWLIRGKREPHSYMLLANTNCNSYTCTTLKHYGTCDDFSENSERGIRVLAGCMIFIFRKAVKQSMTSLQNDINIMSNSAAGGFSWWPSWIWLKTVKNQVYANIFGTKSISCLRRKIFYESSFFCFWCFLASPESMARKLVTYDVINRPNSFQQSTNPSKVCLRNKGSGRIIMNPRYFCCCCYC